MKHLDNDSPAVRNDVESCVPKILTVVCNSSQPMRMSEIIDQCRDTNPELIALALWTMLNRGELRRGPTYGVQLPL